MSWKGRIGVWIHWELGSGWAMAGQDRISRLMTAIEVAWHWIALTTKHDLFLSSVLLIMMTPRDQGTADGRRHGSRLHKSPCPGA